jgi:hypothetical protein
VIATDLEILELWLDGELDVAQGAALQSRLAAEPELALALAELRHQRQERAAFLSALEPSEAEARRIADDILAGVRQRRRLWIGPRLRAAAALAACVAIGFSLGWMGRSVFANAASPVAETLRVYRVDILNENGTLIASQTFNSAELARQFRDDLDRYWRQQPELKELSTGYVAVTSGWQ